METKEYNNIVDLHADAIYRFVLKTLKSDFIAQDVVQETFAKFWEKKESVNPLKAKSYLFTTAYHKCIDELRKAKKSTSMDGIAEYQATFGEHYTDTQEILNDALERLSPVQRSVVLLRDYEGYSYKEIGEITHLQEAQVKVYIFRARKFLRSYLGSLEAII